MALERSPGKVFAFAISSTLFQTNQEAGPYTTRFSTCSFDNLATTNQTRALGFSLRQFCVVWPIALCLHMTTLPNRKVQTE